MGGLFEGDLHVITQVFAPLRLGRILLRGAEEIFENAASTEHFAEDLERIVETARAAKASSPAIEGGVAVLIVGGAFLRIVEHLVRLAELFKFLFGGFVARIFVRMIFN